MRKKNLPLATLFAALLLALAACGGGKSPVEAPTEAPAPAPTEIPVDPAAANPASSPFPGPSPQPATSEAQPETSGIESVLAMGTESLTDLVLNSPELMGCISGQLGFSGLMELAQRPPNDDETGALTDCFTQAGITAQDAVPGALEAPVVTDAPAKVSTPPLTAPAGIPWYEGPFFDSHMHMIGLSNSFYGERFSTSDVLHMMDRNDLQAGVGFYMPPVTGRQQRWMNCWAMLTI